MTEDLERRLVAAFEDIAAALLGIHEIQEKQFDKQWPERKEPRDAVYSRVPTEEDLIREAHGAGSGSLEDWLIVPEEDVLGDHERQFLKAQATARRAEAAESSQPADGDTEAVEGEA